MPLFLFILIVYNIHTFIQSQYIHPSPFAEASLGVAQLVARRLAVRQARVRFSARPHREVFPTEHISDEDMERGFGNLVTLQYSVAQKLQHSSTGYSIAY
jgi:hypothetical protein